MARRRDHRIAGVRQAAGQVAALGADIDGWPAPIVTQLVGALLGAGMFGWLLVLRLPEQPAATALGTQMNDRLARDASRP